MSVSKSQKSVATTQVQVSMGSSRNEASEAPAQKPEIHISPKPALMYQWVRFTYVTSTKLHKFKKLIVVVKNVNVIKDYSHMHIWFSNIFISVCFKIEII